MTIDKLGSSTEVRGWSDDPALTFGLDWLDDEAKTAAMQALYRLEGNLDDGSLCGGEDEAMALFAKDDPPPPKTDDKKDAKKARPDWLDGKTPPKTPMAPDYRRALEQFGAKDSEEMRQKYLSGFTEADYAYLRPEPTPQPSPPMKTTTKKVAPKKVDPYALIPEKPEAQYKRVSAAEANANTKAWVASKRGFDDDLYWVPFSKEERVRLAKLGETTDIREETFRSALEQSGFKYDPQAIDAVMAGYNDDNSVSKSSSAQVREKLMNPGPYSFGISPEARRKLQRSTIEIQKGENSVKEFDLKSQINDETKRIEKEYAAINPPSLLHKAFLDLSKENALKGRIDELTQASTWDPRNGPPLAQTANSVADGIQGTFKDLMAKDPVLGLLPKGAQDEIANFGLGVVKGTVSLAGTAAGVSDFVRDATQDLLLSGADQFGFDTTKVRATFDADRKKSAETWRNVLGAETADMARQEAAYKTKIDMGLRTTPYDVPNWAVKTGELTAKAAPYILVGVATGGASLPIQVATSAAVGGLTAGGEVYNQTRDRPEALKAAAFGAAQGAIAPLGNKLGYAPDLALNTATGYIATKLQNPNASDNEIVFGMMSQVAVGGAFAAGSKIVNAMSTRAKRTLTPDEAKQEYQRMIQEDLPIIKEEVASSAKTNVQNVTNGIDPALAPKSTRVDVKPETDRWRPPPDLIKNHEKIYGKNYTRAQEVQKNELYGPMKDLFTAHYGKTKGATVVEIGPSTTVMVPDALAGRNNKYVAIELSGPAMKRQREFLKSTDVERLFVKGDLYDLPIADGSADVAVILNNNALVSSAPNDKIVAIDNLHRILKKDGQLFLSPWLFNKQPSSVSRHLFEKFDVVEQRSLGVQDGEQRWAFVLKKKE